MANVMTRFDDAIGHIALMRGLVMSVETYRRLLLAPWDLL